MTRTGLATLLAAGLMVAGMLAWFSFRQDREFTRLIARGDSALAAGQSIEAAEAFSGAIALRPESMLAHLKRGDTYRRRGDLAAALRDLRRASQLDPGAVRPRELLGDVNLGLGRYLRAIEDYRAFLALDERSARVLYKLGLTLYRHRQPAEAVAPLTAALALDDRLAEAHYTLALCLRPTAPAAALRSLRRAIELQPAFLAAREELVHLLTAMGRTRDATEQLGALASLEPDSPGRAIAVGLSYARLGRSDTAVSTLSRAIARFPAEQRVRAALGRLWIDLAARTGDRASLPRALTVLQVAAQGPSPSGEIVGLYGRALALAGDLPRAEPWLLQATGHLPVEPESLAALATTAERLGHLATAHQALVDYVDLVPADPDAGTLTRLARLSLRLQDAPAAASWARRAVDQSARSGDDAAVAAVAVLVEALVRANRPEEAREALAAGLSRAPGHPTLSRLARRLTTATPSVRF